jgi:hypothetical protein
MWTTALSKTRHSALDVGIFKCCGALFEQLRLPCPAGSVCHLFKARHFGGFFYSQITFTFSTKGVLV